MIHVLLLMFRYKTIVKCRSLDSQITRQRAKSKKAFYYHLDAIFEALNPKKKPGERGGKIVFNIESRRNKKEL